MKKNIGFALYLGLIAISVHVLIFKDIMMGTSLLIMLNSLCFWLCILGRNKFLNIISVFLAHFIFAVLVIYHRFYDDALSLSCFTEQFGEGAAVVFNAPSLLVERFDVLFIFCSLIISVISLSKNTLYSISVLIRSLLLLPLLAVLILNLWYYYNCRGFLQIEFNRFTRFFSYPIAWEYEIAARSDKNILINLLESPRDLKSFPTFKDIPLAENVYIIQVESLDYNAISPQIMPFLSKTAEQSAFYKVNAHNKKSSANSDFFVLTSQSFFSNSFDVVYNMLPPSYYEKHDTLPQLFHTLGYTSYFYHGNSGHFFNRRPHIEKMGFDKIIFREEAEKFYPSEAWGISDADMADLILRQTAEGKKMHFWITLSMHFDFAIGRKHRGSVSEPHTLRDKYQNSANYTDLALQNLITNSPENSMFIIYSDHDSGTDKDKATAFIVYHKQHRLKQVGTIPVNDIAMIIRQLVEQHSLSKI